MLQPTVLVQLGWTAVSQRRMEAAGVVEPVDVRADPVGDGDPRRHDAVPEIELQGSEEAFDGRVVVAVAASTHAAANTVPRERRPIASAGVLGATIRVVHAWRGASKPDQDHSFRYVLVCASYPFLIHLGPIGFLVFPS
jgi:hypothetical protein